MITLYDLLEGEKGIILKIKGRGNSGSASWKWALLQEKKLSL